MSPPTYAIQVGIPQNWVACGPAPYKQVPNINNNSEELFCGNPLKTGLFFKRLWISVVGSMHAWRLAIARVRTLWRGQGEGDGSNSGYYG